MTLTQMEFDDSQLTITGTSINTLNVIKNGKTVSFSGYITTSSTTAAQTTIATLPYYPNLSYYQYVAAIDVNANKYPVPLRIGGDSSSGKLNTGDGSMPAGTYLIVGSYVTT